MIKSAFRDQRHTQPHFHPRIPCLIISRPHAQSPHHGSSYACQSSAQTLLAPSRCLQSHSRSFLLSCSFFSSVFTLNPKRTAANVKLTKHDDDGVGILPGQRSRPSPSLKIHPRSSQRRVFMDRVNTLGNTPSRRLNGYS